MAILMLPIAGELLSIGYAQCLPNCYPSPNHLAMSVISCVLSIPGLTRLRSLRADGLLNSVCDGIGPSRSDWISGARDNSSIIGLDRCYAKLNVALSLRGTML
ncbi:hypothetical protein [Sphingobacterium sp. NPDC055431]